MEELTLALGDLPGEPLEIPYARIEGRAGDGPHLTVVAGVHGAEYTGMAAVMRLIQRLDPDSLRGTVTAVPVLNQPAFWSRSAFVVPADGKNLNRCFPGDPEGSYTEVLAHEIFTRLIAPSDYVLDLHAGDLPEALEPFCLYEESDVEDRSRRLALAYGLGHVVRQSRATRTVGGSTSSAASDAGIPAIIAEIGANGICDEASVDRHLRGVLAVCAELGMLAGDGAAAAAAPVEYDGWIWLRSPARGFWRPTVVPGQDVVQGEPLGVLLDPLGRELERVLAPAAGCPLFLTTSPAVVADGLLLGLATR
ncbi:MAG: succinylglutamate desuccinylase/aspartoacylase family protein [Blastococcus sp.]